ncbi:UNVERIFIED_CONTAM: hypothetical protein RF653_15175 [Kocuria sp. CPCC 205316]
MVAAAQGRQVVLIDLDPCGLHQVVRGAAHGGRNARRGRSWVTRTPKVGPRTSRCPVDGTPTSG